MISDMRRKKFLQQKAREAAARQAQSSLPSLGVEVTDMVDLRKARRKKAILGTLLVCSAVLGGVAFWKSASDRIFTSISSAKAGAEVRRTIQSEMAKRIRSEAERLTQVAERGTLPPLGQTPSTVTVDVPHKLRQWVEDAQIASSRCGDGGYYYAAFDRITSKENPDYSEVRHQLCAPGVYATYYYGVAEGQLSQSQQTQLASMGAQAPFIIRLLTIKAKSYDPVNTSFATKADCFDKGEAQGTLVIDAKKKGFLMQKGLSDTPIRLTPR